MRILLIGATGGTGQAIIRGALARHIAIVAMVRDPAKLGDLAARIDVRRTSPFEPASIEDGARGVDAAISTIGAPAGFLGRGTTTVYSNTAAALVTGLPRAGVNRLLFCTSAGVEPHDPAEALPYRLIAKPLFLQRAYDDMTVAESMIRSSPLRWTLVRPGRLIDGPTTGRVAVSTRLRTPGGRAITRADVAAFMLDHLDDDTWLHATPTLTSPPRSGPAARRAIPTR